MRLLSAYTKERGQVYPSSCLALSLRGESDVNCLVRQEDEGVLDPQDIDDLETAWGFCLVGYFAAKFPGKQALLQLCNSWKVKYKYYSHTSGWLVFKFENAADRDMVLNGLSMDGHF